MTNYKYVCVAPCSMKSPEFHGCIANSLDILYDSDCPCNPVWERIDHISPGHVVNPHDYDCNPVYSTPLNMTGHRESHY